MRPEERREMLEAEVAALTELIEEEGMTTIGSKGQVVLNPALAARRACLEALRKLDATHPVGEADELEEFFEDD